MKKLLSIGLLTVCALAISEHKAQAWINAKFSVGLNWHLQSANNNFFWGFFKNGQVPGPEAFGGGMGGGYGVVPFGQNPPAGNFPFFGNGPQGAPQGYPTQTAPPPLQSTSQQQAYYGNYYYNPYQTVSYQPGGYYYPNYYYPIYNSYYGNSYQAPYYWYQGR
jgi:hypothetical protein